MRAKLLCTSKTVLICALAQHCPRFARACNKASLSNTLVLGHTTLVCRGNSCAHHWNMNDDWCITYSWVHLWLAAHTCFTAVTAITKTSGATLVTADTGTSGFVIYTHTHNVVRKSRYCSLQLWFTPATYLDDGDHKEVEVGYSHKLLEQVLGQEIPQSVLNTKMRHYPNERLLVVKTPWYSIHGRHKVLCKSCSTLWTVITNATKLRKRSSLLFELSGNFLREFRWKTSAKLIPRRGSWLLANQ